ncbi:MCE family protein [Nocardioides marmoribigeumensis]|uniref:Phospholipid/cholesterol/gamma-HCH transport system substrate-binding protein n=1 Tax=Nocardioides marmoribigeumensis TaxID=433649 RepID=A0ABU2BS66_9ACTN|nr:MCE family protein [Nocardioides marmoribigeumensis]MDR7361116.1 phospholipid/cholesterol/gamma-HCH transport system substrate-binding protein [Nocardioides marmoribigeumensis]
MTRSPARRPRTASLLAALVALVLTTGLSACGPDYGDLPLPGSKVGGETYRLSAIFDEALNLAQGAQVKVNGVPVGRVQTVTAKDFKAKVVMDIKASAKLRHGSQARLRYDTPLGELFIQITPSRTGQPLEDGDALSHADTSTAPTVEDTLAAVSLLINGGGLEQLRTITDELNTALGGREPLVRDTLRRLTTFLAEANRSTRDIDRVLRSLSSTSKVLNARRGTINRALREVIPISRVLRGNTDDIIKLLKAVDDLSTTAKQVVGATKQNILAILRDLGPIMDAVLSTRSQLAPGLRNMIAAADFLDRTVEGDFLPLDATIKLDGTPGGPGGGPGGGPSQSPGPGGLPTALPTIPLPTKLPTILPGGGGGGGGGGGLLGGLSFRAMVQGTS